MSGKENAEMIMDFGSCGQGGAGGASSLALFNGEGRGEAFNRIDIDSGKLGKVMPSMGG